MIIIVYQIPSMKSSSPISAAVTSVESSVDSLLKIWRRRRRWRLLFAPPSTDSTSSGRSPWRIHLSNLLDSSPLQIATLALLIVDLILTVVELASSLISCSTKSTQTPRTTTKSNSPYYYHWAGVAILGVLSLKTLALWVALGGAILKRPGCVVDGVVVAAALGLETAANMEASGGLVVVVSLWRVVRVMESAFEVSDEVIELKIEGVMGMVEALKEENRRLRERIDDENLVIEELQEELDHCSCECCESKCKV